MLFNSLEFFIFLPIVVALYAILPRAVPVPQSTAIAYFFPMVGASRYTARCLEGSQTKEWFIDHELAKDAERTVSVGKTFAVDERLIREIVQLAESKGIEVFMFTAPWLDRQDQGGWHAAAKSLADINERYRDFGDLFRDDAKYFYDLSHLNRRGAEVFTDELTKFLGESTRESVP